MIPSVNQHETLSHTDLVERDRSVDMIGGERERRVDVIGGE